MMPGRGRDMRDMHPDMDMAMMDPYMDPRERGSDMMSPEMRGSRGRDPRMDPRLDPRGYDRSDPRMDSRMDPRGYGRQNPYMDGHRMGPGRERGHHQMDPEMHHMMQRQRMEEDMMRQMEEEHYMREMAAHQQRSRGPAMGPPGGVYLAHGANTISMGPGGIHMGGGMCMGAIGGGGGGYSVTAIGGGGGQTVVHMPGLGYIRI